MNQLNTLSARELSKLDIQGITVSEPYGTLLGEPEKNAVIFIWGEKGAGNPRSALALPTRWPITGGWSISRPKSILEKRWWIA